MNYKNDFNLQGLVNDFILYAESNGIKLSNDFARHLFSSIGASKLLVFPEGSYFYKYLIHVLSGYFGYELFVENVTDEWVSPSRLAQDTFGGETKITRGVAFSNQNPQSLTTVALFGVDFSKTQYLAPLAGYIRAPKLDWVYRIGSNNYKLGQNLWLALVADRGMSLSPNISKYGSWIETFDYEMISRFESSRSQGYYSGENAPREMIINVKNFDNVSMDCFNELVSNALESQEISLDYWKKIDKVEEYLCALCSFKIDNIEARSLERYMAINLALGASEIEAVDSAIASKILPILASYDRSKFVLQDIKLYDFIADLFGEQNVMKSLKVIRKMGL